MKFFLLLIAFLSFALVTVSASVVSISTTTLPNGTLGAKYSAALAASGGCTPYTWSIVSGKLPAGISSKAASNTTALDLTGTPTTAGTYSFTVAVEGCGKHVSQLSYKVTIQASANHVVDLTWKASSSTDVAGYNVYRSPDATTWRRINAGLVPSTLYGDSTVSNGSTYYYAVSAVDIHGKESNTTPAVKAVVP